jgi:hypothetical protein
MLENNSVRNALNFTFREKLELQQARETRREVVA